MQVKQPLTLDTLRGDLSNQRQRRFRGPMTAYVVGTQSRPHRTEPKTTGTYICHGEYRGTTPVRHYSTSSNLHMTALIPMTKMTRIPYERSHANVFRCYHCVPSSQFCRFSGIYTRL